MFKLYKTTFKSKARKILNRTSLFILEYDNTFIYIPNSYDIDPTFRIILKAIYPNLDYQDIPEDDFFKKYIIDRYFRICDKVIKTEEKKQAYYKERKRQSILKQIKKLEEELKCLY